MLENLAKIITEVTVFTNQHKIDAEFYLHRISELKDETPEQPEHWKPYADQVAGVYCFFSADGQETKYIGMSENNTGGRLHYWLFKENKVNESMEDDDIVLSIVLSNEPYMASALETYLIRENETLHNVRR